MYSLDINFLKDRPEYQKEKKPGGTQAPGDKITPKEIAPVAVGLLVAGVLVGGALGVKFFYFDEANAQLEINVGQADSNLKQIDGKKKKIAAIKEEREAIEEQTEALATVFNQIKPWSALLQELRDKAPGNIQMERIQQVELVTQIPPKKKNEKPTQVRKIGLEITGMARSYNDINDFMLLLTKSKLFNGKETELVSATMQDNPTRVEVPEGSEIEVELPPVVKYQIRTFLSDTPAEEMIAELERKGAVGLVSRIESLQKIRK